MPIHLDRKQDYQVDLHAQLTISRDIAILEFTLSHEQSWFRLTALHATMTGSLLEKFFSSGPLLEVDHVSCCNERAYSASEESDCERTTQQEGCHVGGLPSPERNVDYAQEAAAV